MARIRAVKPEFWSSPELPEDPWARLLYIAMWNWADDAGVGTANLRELLGFAFPNDEHLTLADLRKMLAEIRRVFGVKFYTVSGRPYYSIPSWESHQKFDRRSKSRHPGPEEAEKWIYLGECGNEEKSHEYSAESHESTSSTRRDSVAGTEEVGTEEEEVGTEEGFGFASESDDDAEPSNLPSTIEPERDDVQRLCVHLQERIISNGNRRKNITKGWRESARLLLDRDGVSEDDAHRLIDWCQDNDFWPAHIMSMPKFREKYDTLRMQAQRSSSTSSFNRPTSGDEVSGLARARNQILDAKPAHVDDHPTLALIGPQNEIERPF